MDIKSIKKGAMFQVGNEWFIAAEDAHQNFDEKDEPWIVYDIEGNSYFEEDLLTNGTALVGPAQETLDVLLSNIREALCESFLELCAVRDKVHTDEEKASIEGEIQNIANLISRIDAAHLSTRFDCERQIALIWSIEDVTDIRPDLEDKQAMEVLRSVQAHHDCDIGVSWETLLYEAEILYPPHEFEPDAGLLLDCFDAGTIVLECTVNGGKGIQVRCEETDTVLYQTSDARHQYHVGHHITLARYGHAECPNNIAIECEDCNEVILSVEVDGEGPAAHMEEV